MERKKERNRKRSDRRKKVSDSKGKELERKIRRTHRETTVFVDEILAEDRTIVFDSYERYKKTEQEMACREEQEFFKKYNQEGPWTKKTKIAPMYKQATKGNITLERVVENPEDILIINASLDDIVL